jgi:hypothetical protein
MFIVMDSNGNHDYLPELKAFDMVDQKLIESLEGGELDKQ